MKLSIIDVNLQVPNDLIKALNFSILSLNDLPQFFIGPFQVLGSDSVFLHFPSMVLVLTLDEALQRLRLSLQIDDNFRGAARQVMLHVAKGRSFRFKLLARIAFPEKNCDAGTLRLSYNHRGADSATLRYAFSKTGRTFHTC